MSFLTKLLLGLLSAFLVTYLLAARSTATFPGFLEKYRRNGVAQSSRKQVQVTVLVVLILMGAVILSGLS